MSKAEAALVMPASLPPDPLDDFYWRERESGLDCCYDCSPNHPDVLLWDARDEIDTHLKRSTA